MNMMTTAMTASVPSAPTTPMTAPMITSRLVGLYREGKIEQAENYATWAWGNHYHITVNMFENAWAAETPAQNPPAIVSSADVADGNEKKRSVLTAILSDFAEAQAKERFGKDLPRWRNAAKHLEILSEDARAKRFDRVLGEGHSIQDVWDHYEEIYYAITPLIMTHLAPGAMSPDDFIAACADKAVYGQIPAMTCPACSGREFHRNDALLPTVLGEKLMVSFFCDGCGFPLDAVVRFS